MSDQIIIKSFHATSDPEICARFYEGHINVLKSYGVEPISSAKQEWFNNPAVYGVVAELNGAVVGGVKIHMVGGTQLLPVEEAVGYIDERLYGIVAEKAKNGAGEACGLWNAREVSGWGLSNILMLAVVSLTDQLKINTLFGLSSDHTIELFKKLGYHIITDLGDHGDFVYPTPEYLARVIMMETKTLSDALPYNKEIIFALRNKPNQVRLESNKKGEMEVNYELLLPVTAR